MRLSWILLFVFGFLFTFLYLKPEEPKQIGPNYYDHIEPILARSCYPCHRSRGNASFLSLDSFEQTRQHRKKILRWVQLGLMPPWLASPQKQRFRHDISLTKHQKALLGAWVQKPVKGDYPIDKMKKVYDAAGILSLPKPDQMNLHFETPHAVKVKRGEKKYLCYYFKNPYFSKDSYIRGTYSTADESKHVHHVSTFLVPRENNKEILDLYKQSSFKGFECGEDKNNGFSTNRQDLKLATLGLGMLEENTGIKVPKGYDYLIQIHFDTTMLEEDFYEKTKFHFSIIDQVKFPIYVIYFNVGFEDINIPANANNHWVQFKRPTSELLVDHLSHEMDHLSSRRFYVHGVAGHMHGAGKKLNLSLLLSNNSIQLLNIDSWNLNYDIDYWFKKPIPLSYRSQLKLICRYDNSAQNPQRPLQENKSILIRGGIFSSDEMCTGVLYVSTQL